MSDYLNLKEFMDADARLGEKMREVNVKIDIKNHRRHWLYTFAGQAMAGIIANGGARECRGEQDLYDLSIEFAKDLLERLEG